MTTFRLVLKLHAPVILPKVTPRLDVLLREGLRRQTQDWKTDHALPLVYDDDIGGYRASQLIFATMPGHFLSGTNVIMPTGLLRGEPVLSDLKQRNLRQDGGPHAPRLSRHRAYVAPYAVFYAEGDVEECCTYLSTIKAVGREHKRHCGAFSVHSVEPVTSSRWALRPWPLSQRTLAEKHVQTNDWIVDHQSVLTDGVEQPVVRPPRIIKERLYE